MRYRCETYMRYRHEAPKYRYETFRNLSVNDDGNDDDDDDGEDDDDDDVDDADDAYDDDDDDGQKTTPNHCGPPCRPPPYFRGRSAGRSATVSGRF